MTAEMTNSAKGLGDKGEEIYRKHNENRQQKNRKSEPHRPNAAVLNIRIIQVLARED